MKKFPKDFSFAGLRFIPNLFNVANTFLFFYLLLFLLKNRHLAFFLTSLYLFNNNYILHARGAMLDSTQIFFIFVALLYFLRRFSAKKNNSIHYFLLAIPIGLAICTKLNGAIFLLLFPFLFFWDYSKETKKIFLFLVFAFSFLGKKFFKKNKERETTIFLISFKKIKKPFLTFLKSLALKSFMSILGLLAVIFTVFYLHAKIGTKVQNGKYYKASTEYKTILNEKKSISFYHVPLVVRDYYNYMVDYHSRVPKLDKCKSQGENGSYPTEWILGSKAIKYSWYGLSGGGFYLYSVPNFLILLFGLFGLISSVSLLLGVFLFKLPIRDKKYDKKTFLCILFFTIIYFCYMGAMLSIDRVMYLYHYFVPSFLSLLMGVGIFRFIFNKEIDENNKKVYISVMIFTLQIIIVFIYFGGFTYGWFSTINDFIDKNWLPIWKLEF